MKLLLLRMVESSGESIKAACRGWAEVTSAYRFFDNDKVTVDKILAPHQFASQERVRAVKRVLCVQDTSELDFTSKHKLSGRGPLSTTDRRGFFFHSQLLLTPEGLPLGVWDTNIYARDDAEHGKAAERKSKPIEEKESYRWLEGFESACRLAELASGTQVIACGDRENDIYEVFEAHHKRQVSGKNTAELLIRCNQNRVIEGKETIRSALETAPLLGVYTLKVTKKAQFKKKGGNRSQSVRTAREAVMEVFAKTVTLRPPYRKGTKLEAVTMTVVMTREKDPPVGEDPVEWVLLTTLAATDLSSAMEVIKLYAVRWEIEVFHRVLKTGCRVEDLQLKEADRITPCIALYMIVSWRLMYLTKLGRECPELPCDVLFEEDEWQAFWVVVRNGAPDALAQKPSLAEFMNKVAEAGGYLGRKSDGPPGPQAIWQGLQKVRSYTVAWQIYVKQGGYKAFPHN
jgi:hypothetical protein